MYLKKYFLYLLIFTFLIGCSSNNYIIVDSENYDSRVKYLVIHYTSEGLEDSINLLTTKKDHPVSAHYLIAEDAKIYQLVSETKRAWHAGKSFWKGERGLNDSSIGIEIVNKSECMMPMERLKTLFEILENCNFVEYPKVQINQLIKLSKEIIARHPRIKPYNIVAHSDIAPTRKIDPGPLFPWKDLADQGVGAWYDQIDYISFQEIFSKKLPDLKLLQKKLRKLGYEIEPTGANDFQSISAIRSFQLHFRPKKYDGFFDVETAAILYALLKKYNLT